MGYERDLLAHYAAVHRRLWPAAPKPQPKIAAPPIAPEPPPPPPPEPEPQLGPVRVRRVRPGMPRIEEVQWATCVRYGLNRDDLLSRHRTIPLVHRRHVSMYVARLLTGRSLTAIGQAHGHVDHTSVFHACKQTAARMAAAPEVAADVEAIIRMVRELER